MASKRYNMRYRELDFIRGFAIILMIVFHISFDLNNFHFIDINIYHSKDWFHFRMVIVTLFILGVGISLSLAHQSDINTHKVLKRFVVLASNVLLITVATMIVFPSSWIYFGVLHFITFASLVALLFLRLEFLNLLIGGVIVVLFNLKLINMHWLFEFLQPILHLPLHTEDLVPLTPWFGVVLIGIFIGKKRLFLFSLPENGVTNFIGILGKHSLLIYMAHQPLFFGTIALADYFFHKS